VALVGCSLLSGLLMQSVATAGPDGVREQGPILLIRLWRLGHRLSLFPVWPVCHHFASRSQPREADLPLQL